MISAMVSSGLLILRLDNGAESKQRRLSFPAAWHVVIGQKLSRRTTLIMVRYALGRRFLLHALTLPSSDRSELGFVAGG